ncbi:hypothetical protein ASD18_12135 [Cellulomonas sp. Root137]|nr:hypothetical protein ASD18_12135 [Cellulomonas sp. Root137]
MQALSAPDALTPPASLLSSENPREGGVAASRMADRTELSGCSGIFSGRGSNGRLAKSDLCDLWQKPYRDRADAVATITDLNSAYTARFGEPICLSSGYRTIEEQAALRSQKGGLAAPAGQSNHGWGLAVDLCPEAYAAERGKWLHDVGPVYGWANPDWAHRGGDGPYEPWHWEFVPGVEALADGS